MLVGSSFRLPALALAVTCLGCMVTVIRRLLRAGRVLTRRTT
jgi:hypothetical protein